MNWNLSSPMIFLKRRALTAPLNCSTWGTCSSLYHLLNAASLSLVMVARTMKMVTAIGVSPEMTAACGHDGTASFPPHDERSRVPHCAPSQWALTRRAVGLNSQRER